VRTLLQDYRSTEHFLWLREEADYIRRYRQAWAVAP